MAPAVHSPRDAIMKDDRVSSWFTTGSAAAQPQKGTLFYEAVIEPRRDTREAGNDIAPLEPRPSLTLVHDEDDEIEEAILRDYSEPLDTVVPTIAELTSSEEDDHDAWPWEDEVESSRGRPTQVEEIPPPVIAAAEAAPIPPCREDDHSASEDVVLCEPTAVLAGESVFDSDELGDNATIPHDATAPAYELKTVATPRRIGSGQLVPARLTWRPGDPFGGAETSKLRFRWELMLTSACVTAACGLCGIWLLRTLLA